MAPVPDDLPVVREGTARRTLLAATVGWLMLEVGLRVLLGNFGQTAFVRPAEDPLSCAELVPGADATYSGWLQRVGTSSVRISAAGVRGPALDVRRRPGVLRIAALGDAFTFGLGVDAEDSFLQVASRAMQREGLVNQTLNFAVPGLSTPQEVHQALSRVTPYRPDVVLLVVSPDDLRADDSWCARPPIGGTAGRLLRHLYVPRVAWLLLRHLRRPGRPAAASRPGGSPEARFTTAVRALHAAASEQDFALAVVVLSDADAFTDPTYCEDCTPAQDLLNDLDVDVVDLAPVWRQLRADRDTAFLRGEGHLSKSGNLRVGLQLAQALTGWSDLQRRAAERSARLRP